MALHVLPHIIFVACCFFSAAATTATRECRDRFLEPFSSASIWNTAIGSEAQYSHAHLFAQDPPPSFHNDQDFFLRVDDADPLTDWIHQGDWGSDDHCAVTGAVVAQIRLPRDWTTASDGKSAGQANNNAMGVLLEDNLTIVQMQPAYRCGAGTPLLARWGNASDGCPQQFPNTTSVLGDGALGSHGGSGLSGVGGTVRLGELLESSGPIAHALKLELEHRWYYGGAKLQPETEYNGGRCQYRWPATGSDGGTQTSPGGLYTGTDPNVAPGALLAIPPGVLVNVTSVPGAKLLRALTDYGGYLVDDTGGGGNTAALCMEASVNDEMRRNFGYAMTYPEGVSPTSDGRALYRDLLAIFQHLHAVTNSGPGAVGGGGTPRVPTKPPICGATSEDIFPS